MIFKVGYKSVMFIWKKIKFKVMNEVLRFKRYFLVIGLFWELGVGVGGRCEE